MPSNKATQFLFMLSVSSIWPNIIAPTLMTIIVHACKRMIALIQVQGLAYLLTHTLFNISNQGQRPILILHVAPSFAVAPLFSAPNKTRKAPLLTGGWGGLFYFHTFFHHVLCHTIESVQLRGDACLITNSIQTFVQTIHDFFKIKKQMYRHRRRNCYTHPCLVSTHIQHCRGRSLSIAACMVSAPVIPFPVSWQFSGLSTFVLKPCA